MEIILRPLEKNDAKISWKWRNDPEIWKYTGRAPDQMITEEMERDWAKKAIENPTRINYAICLKDGTYVGNIYAVNIKNNIGELGIFLGDKRVWGKGIAKQALALFKTLLREKHCLTQLNISVDIRNTVALRCYLSCGAVFPEGGHMMMEMKL